MDKLHLVRISVEYDVVVAVAEGADVGHECSKVVKEKLSTIVDGPHDGLNIGSAKPIEHIEDVPIDWLDAHPFNDEIPCTVQEYVTDPDYGRPWSEIKQELWKYD